VGGVSVSEIFEGVAFDISSGSTQTRLPQGSQDVIEFVSMRQRSIDFEVWSRLSRLGVNIIIATRMSMNTHFIPLNTPRLSLISSTETFIWLNLWHVRHVCLPKNPTVQLQPLL
jgi:hypothetical protein